MGNESTKNKEQEQAPAESEGQTDHEGAAPYPGENAVKFIKGKLFGGGGGGGGGATTTNASGAAAGGGETGKEKAEDKEADKKAADPTKKAEVDTTSTKKEEAPQKDVEPKKAEPVSKPAESPDSAPKKDEAPPGPPPTVPTLEEAIGAAVKGNKLSDALKLVAADPAKGLAALGGNKSAFMTLIRDTRPHTTAMRAQITALYNAADFATKQEIFSARFKVTLLAEGSEKFTEDELNTLHAQAVLLPPGHVEGLGSFKELKRSMSTADAEGTADGTGITMRDQQDVARYSQVFRHEVGHAVDTALGGECESFRSSQGGWTQYAGIDAFIAAAGGYGNVPEALKDTVKLALEKFLAGGGPWDSPASFDDSVLEAAKEKNPGVTEAADKSDKVSKAVGDIKALYGSNVIIDTAIGSTGRFYGSDAQSKWPQAASKAFFFNFYYHTPFSVAAATHNDLKTWGNDAAGFSDKEWFAEIYAEWYSTATPGSSRSFPGFVQTFFNNKVAKVGAPEKAPGPESGNPKAK